ncbi:cysteine proteinase inhibitor A-like [Rutidosis leptorrhynchoides]|uniref:cysteine proteinase inhibitor A-like n=1 Tax=Rutidosis leptorrhynchoides TaxID=125765 RepID=UPI003A99DD64
MAYDHHAPLMRNMRITIITIIPVLLNVLLVGFGSAENGQKTVGNWLEIVSPDDPVVIEVAKFALEEHNNDTNSSLKFERVVKGENQIVGGINWRLTIEVEDDNSIKNCEALVYEQPWEDVRQLSSFKIIE